MPGNTYCVVVGCMNNFKQQKDLVFFRIPKDKARMKIWTRRIGRLDIASKRKPSDFRVCSAHFIPSMYVNKRLHKKAAPILNLPEDIDFTEQDLEEIRAVRLSPVQVTRDSNCSPALKVYPKSQVKPAFILNPPVIKPPVSNPPDDDDITEQDEEELLTRDFNCTPALKVYPKPQTKTDKSSLFGLKAKLRFEEDSIIPIKVTKTVVNPSSVNKGVVNPSSVNKAVVNPSSVNKAVVDPPTIKIEKLDDESIEDVPMVLGAGTSLFISTDLTTLACDDEEIVLNVEVEGNKNLPFTSICADVDPTHHFTEVPIVASSSQQDVKPVDTQKQLTSMGTSIPKCCEPDKTDSLHEKTLKTLICNVNKISDESRLAINSAADMNKNVDLTESLTLNKVCARKRKLNENSLETQSSLKTSHEVQAIKICNSKGFFFKILEWQKKLNSMPTGIICNREREHVAWNLYLSSPQRYQLLQHTFSLPSVEIIEKMKVHFNSGVCDDLITLLSKRFKKSPFNSKYCVINLKEVALKRNLSYDAIYDEIIGFQEIDGRKQNKMTDHAVVMMLRGCIEDYKQLLGYAFTGTGEQFTDLNNWLDKTIEKLNDAGFVVCAVVSDQGFNFANFAKSRGVSAEHPYFIINNKKVFYIFDVPDLYKTIYNHYLSHDFFYDGNKQACLKHVVAFCNRDKLRNIPMAPKLLQSHDDMGTCSAKNVLSYSVAAGMSAEIEMGHLPASAQETVDFVLLLDQLYDVLNSRKLSDPNNFKRAFTGEANQVKFLRDSLEVLENVKVIKDSIGGTTEGTKVFISLQITINAILQLHYYLQSEGLQYIFTSRFNHEEILSSLKAIEQRLVKKCERPTPAQFKKAFLEEFSDCLFQDSLSANYEADFDSLFQLESDKLFKKELFSQLNEPIIRTNSGCVDSRIIHKPFKVLCGYILKKCSQKHTCPILRQHIITSNKRCVIPSVEFINYIELYNGLFLENFKESMLLNGVVNKLFTVFQEMSLSFKNPCDCFPVEYFIKLYLKVRISFAITFDDIKVREKSSYAVLPH